MYHQVFRKMFCAKAGSWILVLLAFAGSLKAQQSDRISPRWLSGGWSAQWITCPAAQQRAYGVYHFRKKITLQSVPKSFVIHVTADNRYRLFVNGKPVGRGPARGDLYNWNFETYDIASYLHSGENTLAALVWNMAEYGPVAQVSNQTGFLLQGDGDEEKAANSGSSWKVMHDSAYSPCATNMGAVLRSYFVVGPGDDVQADRYPWGWQDESYDDSLWQMAEVIPTPVVPVGYGTDNLWSLTPRTIPQMEESMQRLGTVRQSTGLHVSDAFLNGGHPLNVPAHSKVTVLLDQRYETTAYPVLTTTGGKDAAIKISYAEALFDDKGQKGNRNDITGKTMRGFYDIFHPDGGKQRTFSPLWFRTYRYVQLDIRTGDDPLTLDDFYGLYTGYPFERKAAFASNDSSLQEIWKVGWRTARLCAGETYYDCPYYEELQYEADTRIQALISLYNTGDDRLMRKAIHDFYLSRVPEGLTQGRYPSSRLQVIPPFSLFWVSMLYDYWMHRKDDAFLQQYIDAAAGVLKWYETKIDASKEMLGPMKWWNFVDWNNAFPNGVPDGANDGNSAVVTLQYAYTLEQAAGLFSYFGRKELADHYEKLAQSLARSTYSHCFDKSKMEMANTPEKKTFSQHAGIMAILSGAVPAGEMQPVLKNILNDSTLSQATFYYRFYLTRAMIKAGLGDLYYSQLTPWRNMLKNGLTTFAENPDPTRSDCHAWSASPIYDFLATLCGIMPAAPGFSRVRIAPHPGTLTVINGSLPLPEGNIRVSLQRKGAKGIHATVYLPGSLTGEFIWQGKQVSLKPGSQQVDL